MKLLTPEKFLEKDESKVSQHHGTCDMCNRRNILILHFGYNTQPKRSYRICQICFAGVCFGLNEYWEVE